MHHPPTHLIRSWVSGAELPNGMASLARSPHSTSLLTGRLILDDFLQSIAQASTTEIAHGVDVAVVKGSLARFPQAGH